MRGLTILVAVADPARFRSALMLAAAQAALGGAAHVFVDAEAVTLVAARDPGRPGRPALAELIETAFDLGVRITLCQTGIALCGFDLSRLDPRFEAAGVTTILAELGDDRLVAL